MCTLEMDMLSLVFPFFAREVAYGLGQTKHLPYVLEQANTCRMYSNKRTPAVCTRTSEHPPYVLEQANTCSGAVCTRTSVQVPYVLEQANRCRMYVLMLGVGGGVVGCWGFVGVE